MGACEQKNYLTLLKSQKKRLHILPASATLNTHWFSCKAKWNLTLKLCVLRVQLWKCSPLQSSYMFPVLFINPASHSPRDSTPKAKDTFFCNIENCLSIVPTSPNKMVDGSAIWLPGATGQLWLPSPCAHSYRSFPLLPDVFECGLACLWMRLSNYTTFHSQYAADFLHNKTCVSTPRPYLHAHKYPFSNCRQLGGMDTAIQWGWFKKTYLYL